jgi:hypothetical protein
MAIRDRKLTSDAVPVLKRKDQKTLRPRRGKINLVPKFSVFVARRKRCYDRVGHCSKTTMFAIIDCASQVITK